MVEGKYYENLYTMLWDFDGVHIYDFGRRLCDDE
jgi:hypothetical protein